MADSASINSGYDAINFFFPLKIEEKKESTYFLSKRIINFF